MNHTLDQVDQEEKKKRSGGPKQHWTAVQYLERLETQLRLWRKRRRMERAEREEPERPVRAAAGERRTAGSVRVRNKTGEKQVYGGEPQTAAPAAVRRSRPAVTDLRSLKEAVSVEAAHVRRRWRHIRKEAKAQRFPESSRRPIQLVLMLAGLLPMIGNHFRERVRSRHQRSVRRSNGMGAWMERHKLRPAVFFTVAAVVAATALFSSFYTVGTTVTYDGEVVGSVASERAAKTACKDLEKVTKEALGGSYTLSDSLVQYSTSLMPRSQLVDSETFEEELSDSIGLVTYGYTLYVDGERIGATPYKGALEELLQQLKDGVSDENTISCGFRETVEVKEGYVPTEQIMNLGYLAEMLYSTKTEEVTYTVKAGDTWSEIAEDHDMTSKELLELNPGYNINRLSIGEVLTMSAAVPYLTLTVTERECYVADIPYDVEYTDSAYLYKDQEKVLSPGSYGKADRVANVTYVNGEETERTVLSSVTLLEPVTEQRARGTKERPTWLPTGSFRWPCSGTITSRFGYRNLKYSYASTNHKGIDIANKKGTPIVAADGGTVIYAGWMSGYGYLVQIDHGNGFVTYYGHNSKLLVSVGQHVYKGQQIAAMGSTGNSTGNHCHFEIRYNGVPKNPLNYL